MIAHCSGRSSHTPRDRRSRVCAAMRWAFLAMAMVRVGSPARAPAICVMVVGVAWTAAGTVAVMSVCMVVPVVPMAARAMESNRGDVGVAGRGGR